MDNFIWDQERKSRTGLAEAVFCENKTTRDLNDIIAFNMKSNAPVLFTRMSSEQWGLIDDVNRKALDYDEHSETAILNVKTITAASLGVCIVAAGTSDLNVAQEVKRTLFFNGVEAPIFADVGVAGLWRLMDKIEDIRRYKIIIALAGMEGALFSVLAGLVEAPVIAVPTSVGYGVSAGGRTALDSALGSCAPGIMTVNIDNGFGAANAAIKIINQYEKLSRVYHKNEV